MAYINPVNAGAADYPSAIGRAAAQGGHTASTPGSTGTSPVMQEITQMLSQLGGNLHNDEMLKMLLAMVVIMAMLSEQSKSDPAGMQAGMPMTQQGSFVSQSISITSISIQQTSIEQTAYYGTGSQGQNGEQLDMFG